MKPTPYQSKILALAVENGGQFTAKQAFERFAWYYHRHGEKYVGEAVRRMVASGFLRRVKRGVYAIGNQAAKEATNPSQTKMEL
jgi:predicted transcriptional regulator of viral defense system